MEKLSQLVAIQNFDNKLLDINQFKYKVVDIVKSADHCKCDDEG